MATICTGEFVLEPVAGMHMVMEGAAPAPQSEPRSGRAGREGSVDSDVALELLVVIATAIGLGEAAVEL